jgi:LPXTG-site transpeptidase (sortase) family protein
MNSLVHSIARLILAAQKAWTRKWTFLAFSLCVFLVSIIVLGNLNLLPDPQTVAAAASDSDTTPDVMLAASPLVATTATTTVNSQGAELPVKVEIPAISLSVTVANPTTTNIDTLDQYLLSGAVRYPTSAELGENGNVVIFGHSSYLPVVNNQAYKTFDGIQKLKVGDTITVYSSDTAYTYAVQTVNEEDANSAGIPLTVSGAELTLATCDSFATKNDRFVVTADFVESHSISS